MPQLTATSFLETVSLRLDMNIEVAVVMPLCLVDPLALAYEGAATLL